VAGSLGHFSAPVHRACQILYPLCPIFLLLLLQNDLSIPIATGEFVILKLGRKKMLMDLVSMSYFSASSFST
jgi:hypothetical protein